MAALQLPPLPEFQPSWEAFQVWWQQVKDAIERNEAAQQVLFDTIDSVLGEGGTGMVGRLSILGSFTIPTLVLTASDAGASATIAIAGHVRHYGDGTNLSLAAGSLTGKSYSTTYAVYYDDIDHENAAPTYVATTDLEEAQHNYAEGRHYVGTVTTPAAAGPPTTGGSPPAGSGYTAGSSAVVIT